MAAKLCNFSGRACNTLFQNSYVQFPIFSPCLGGANSNMVWVEVVSGTPLKYNTKTHSPGFRLSFSQLKICPAQMTKLSSIVAPRSEETFAGHMKNSLWDYL